MNLSPELRSQVMYVDVLIVGAGPAGMAAAIAAIGCKEPVTVRRAQAVEKSYPDFWNEYQALGGQIHVFK